MVLSTKLILQMHNREGIYIVQASMTVKQMDYNIIEVPQEIFEYLKI